MNTKIVSLGMMLSVTCLVCSGHSQTIPNPSFEQPGYPDPAPTFRILGSGSTFITDWTVGGQGIDYFKVDTASDGTYFVDLVRGPGQGGSVTTTITGLTAGQSYQLTLDTNVGTLLPGSAVIATVDSTSRTYLASLIDVWQSHELTFTATSSTASLIFAGPTSGGIDEDVFVDNATLALGPGRLLNISTRLRVLTGDNALIGGFIITGSDPKKVIVRGLGPSLTSQNVPGALVDPVLELRDHTGALIASNDNWKDTQQSEIEASTIAPSNDLESAIVMTLDPAAYTAILRGKSNGTGVGLVEVYDLASSANSKLANISTRGFVDTGDNVMIGGFIVGAGGGGSANVIVRAIGPSLTAAGVPGALQDPTLELHNGHGTVIGFNDNWKDVQQADITASTIPPTDDRESAIAATLRPGPYTAIVRGKNDTTGVGLVEVYNVLGTCVAPPANLVAWYPGDGNANDIQGSHNGSLQSGATFAAAKVGQGFSFDGTGASVSIPYSPDLYPSGSYSVDAWIKTSQTAGAESIITLYECANFCPSNVANSAYSFVVQDGHLVGYIRDSVGADQLLNGTTGVADNKFHHVAMVRDIESNQLLLYLDGAVESSATLTVTGALKDDDGEPDPITIGAQIENSSGGGCGCPIFPFSGVIDEVEYFNRALSAGEVLAIYNAGSFGKCKP
jgi:Concanavalin A-like lectin/glucanases superfamily/Protein of unknown function (DUF642)